MGVGAPLPVLFLAGLVVGAGCEPNGDGFVRADFSPPDCPPGERNEDLVAYSWEAQFLATDRYFEIVIIQVQRFRVDLFETDSVGIRLDLEGLERSGLLVREGRFYRPAMTPLTIPIEGPDEVAASEGLEARDQAQVVLSLFGTCERFPGYTAVSGSVVFDELRLRIDGSETGDNERLIGRVETASLSYEQAPAPIGVLEATFAFDPPERPLREFE